MTLPASGSGEVPVSDRFPVGQAAAVLLIAMALRSASGADVLTVPAGTVDSSGTQDGQRAALGAQAADAVHLVDRDDDRESGFAGLGEFTPVAVARGANRAPVAAIGGDDAGRIVVDDTDRSGSERVTLDGSGSYDSDGAVVDHRWSWLDGDGVIRNASGAALTVDLAVGPHYYFTLIVEDDDGAVSSGRTVAVRVAPNASGAARNDPGPGLQPR